MSEKIGKNMINRMREALDVAKGKATDAVVHVSGGDEIEKGHLGQSFDEFLAEQGLLEECEEQALKEMRAHVDEKNKGITENER